MGEVDRAWNKQHWEQQTSVDDSLISLPPPSLVKQNESNILSLLRFTSQNYSSVRAQGTYLQI